MPKRVITVLLILTALTLLAACGQTQEAADTADAAEAAETAEATEAADTAAETAAAETTEADTTAADPGPAADTYTVIFDSRGGSAVEDAVIEVGRPLHLGANPTREGYTFVTWEDQWGMPIGQGEENVDVDWETEAGQVITLYAVWE